MAVTVADHYEQSTQGWFNALDEDFDMTAISTMGIWHGQPEPTLNTILALVTGVKSKMKLTTGIK